MAFIPVPNTLKVELVMSWDTQVVENVLHYEWISAWSIARANELAADIVSWWNATMDAYVANTVSLNLIRMTDLESETGFVVNYATGLPVAGANTNPSLPNSNTVVITKRTANRGRSFRGRIYQVGLTENVVTANAVSSTVVGQLIAAWELIRVVALTGGDAQMGVVSLQSNLAPRTEGIITPITNFTSDGVIDSQRRRLPGRGR